MFRGCLPYSLYIILSKKEDLSGDWQKSEDAAATVRWDSQAF
nr:MAG TPA: hypothetical protein [Caudoviricetes sp.]